MKLLKTTFIWLIACAFFACSKKEIVTSTHSGTASEFSFDCRVLLRSDQLAVIEWDEPEVPFTSIRYDVWVNGILVRENLVTLTDTLTGLSPDSIYDGRVVAYNESNKNENASDSFHLGKIEGFIYYTDNVAYNRIYCINMYTGAQLWEKNNYDISSMSSIARPVVVNDTLFTCSGRQVAAMNARTGVLYWNTKVDDIHNNNFLVYEGGVLYVNGDFMDNTLFALNASNGNTIWSALIGRPNTSQAPLFVKGDKVFSSSGSDGTIAAFTKTTGSLLWQYTARRSDDVSYNPVQINANMYTWDQLLIVQSSNGYLQAINQATGARVWERKVSGVNFSANSLGFYQNYLLASGNEGSNDGLQTAVYCIQAETGTIVWQKTGTMGGKSLTQGILMNGNARTYLNGSGFVSAVDVATGNVIWDAPYVGGGLVYAENELFVSSPAVNSITVYDGFTGISKRTLPWEQYTTSTSTPVVMVNNKAYYPLTSGMLK
ncbi:outer membrane protein assembly factor BamB [Filimonas zeae]|uniref:Pyrrolo-quinoline quinone repeat domain-containing protein n=1 Tax=Filimonas zeae TaxID=1737353 RepID=A0A917IYG5_9BACT|nr:PQQ-binding-like beta-propeller repeat protein [Filimonas zeae]MDR6339033.1 outer membrane protein assembly factor BamB [Filimonas zeae]GGH65425.1 hypothetical protein GCM10011379_18540 [Filimonas zeae]